MASHRRIHDAASDYGSSSLPVVIEIVDAPGGSTPSGRPGPTARGGDGDGPAGPRDPYATPIGGDAMMIEGDARRVTIYIGSRDTWHGRNLAAAIVERCRSLGLAGATLTRGVMGFGKNSRIHRAHLLGLSDDLPERIEVVDRPDGSTSPAVLDEMVGGGLIVLEDVCDPLPGRSRSP